MTAVARRKHTAADGTRHVKKSPGLLCPRLELRYAFMSEPQQTWPVTVLCAVWPVSRRGFDAYRQRQATARGERAALRRLTRVHAIPQETGHRDGSRRLAKPLQDEGCSVGRDKARRLMKPAGVAVGRPTRRPVTPDRRHGDAVAPNLWARQFDVEPPDTVWAGDITYLWTAEGWWYRAPVLDMDSRTVVGWAMSRRIEAALVQEAWRMALGRRRPSAGLRHHADRGSQYACGTSQALLAEHGIRCRMSRTGDGLDHAVAERFFGSVTGERTSRRHDATRQEARDEVIDDIEMFDNSRRKHSYLGYVSPNEFEKLAVVAYLSVYFYLTTTGLSGEGGEGFGWSETSVGSRAGARRSCTCNKRIIPEPDTWVVNLPSITMGGGRDGTRLALALSQIFVWRRFEVSEPGQGG